MRRGVYWCSYGKWLCGVIIRGGVFQNQFFQCCFSSFIASFILNHNSIDFLVQEYHTKQKLQCVYLSSLYHSFMRVLLWVLERVGLYYE